MARLEQGRNFNNKLWNALKLVRLWGNRLDKPGKKMSETDPGMFAWEWFENRFSQAKIEVNRLFGEFKISEALKSVYSLFWDDFCSWYLEWVKPGFEQPMNPGLYDKTITFFEDLLLWLHPFMPFVTEEVYHLLRERKPNDDLCIIQLAPENMYNQSVLEVGEKLRLFLTLGREFRQQQQLKNSEALTRLFIPKEIFGERESLYAIIRKQINCTKIEFRDGSYTSDSVIQVIPFLSYQVGFESPKKLDDSKRREEMEKELTYYKGFLESLNKKLSNERFVLNAKPEVIDLEKKKKADTEEKIAAIILALKA